MKASNISKETLQDVCVIQADLASGARPTIAHNVKVEMMKSPSQQPTAQRTILIEREDGSAFSDANEAREELHKQPLRKMLFDLNFKPGLSVNADKFYKTLIEYTGGRSDPINRADVNQVAKIAELNSEELSNVLAELDGKQIDCHAGGMISLQPEGF